MPCFFNHCTPKNSIHKSSALSSQQRRRRERPAFLETPKPITKKETEEMTPDKNKREKIRTKSRSKSSPDMSKKSKIMLRRGLRFSSTERKTSKKLAVVLDLDETLIHSRFVNKDDGTIRQRERRKTATVATNEFILNIGDETIRVNRRPGLNKFLVEASELFDLYIFTAAIEEYACPVIDYLDPHNKIFTGRFYRGSCFQMPNRTYAKDLFHICDDLKRVVLVDNNCNSFALQKSNGIPISSFYDDSNDIALTKLMKFLKYLTNVQDVRPRLQALFNVCEVPRRRKSMKSQTKYKKKLLQEEEKENLSNHENLAALSTTAV